MGLSSQLDGSRLSSLTEELCSCSAASVSLGVAGLAGWCMCFLSIAPELCSLGHCADLCSARSHTSFGSWILPPLSLLSLSDAFVTMCGRLLKNLSKRRINLSLTGGWLTPSNYLNVAIWQGW